MATSPPELLPVSPGFYPPEIKFNKAAPKVVITSISQLVSNPSAPSDFVLLDDRLLESGQIELSHEHSYLQFEFAILNFLNPHRNQFQYRLTGFDDRWISSPSGNKAIYPHLPAGSYEFQVKGTNNDGVVSQNMATIRLIVHPPWWQTWPVRITVALLIAVSVFLGFRFRIDREKARNRQLQEKVDERTLELVAANQQLEARGEQIEAQNQELSFQKVHLEDLVNERTRELRKALQKAEESDRLKSAFLENLTHEIRTPLNAIIGFSHLLLEAGISTKEKEEYSNLIRLSGDNLTEIVDNMIDVSMMRTRQLKISKQPVAASELLLSLHRQFEDQIGKNVKFNVELPDQNILVEADHLRLKQVLVHLIKNALKFTASGTVTLGLRPIAEHARFFVKDTGVGISEEKLSAIFDPFYKVVEDRKVLYGGTGIGLSLCQHLLALHDTTIEVESETQKGSIFYFDLPVMDRIDNK